MSLEDIYDADCHLIKPPDTVKEEEDLIESINKKHLDGIGKNQYSIEFLKKLDKLLNEDIIDFDYDDSNYTMEIGCYFDKKGNYDYAKKYYLMAIEKGNSDAMYRLGDWYRNCEPNNMLKYYLMSINNGNEVAMHNLALYYQEEKKDYDNMKKYYLMAIEKGHSYSMYHLGSYYNEKGDYDNMKKYYLMAINNGSDDAMYHLGNYYEEIEDYNNMKKYYLMAIEKGNVYAMFLLGFYYENKNLCVIQDEKNKIELIEDENLAIKYMLMTIENGKDNYKMQVGDAASSLGCIYGERKDKENMRKYFLLCEAITPDDQKRKEAKHERELYEKKY